MSDGAIVEWVKDCTDPTKIRFLVWKGGRGNIQDSVTDNGQVFFPPAFDRTMAKAIRLPTGILACGGPEELLNEIAAVLRDHIDFPDEKHPLIPAFSLSTWFPEFLRFAPYLVISGPPGSGKTTLLKLLGCLCRRSLLLGDISCAALYRLTDLLRPTLLLDESEFDGTKESRDRRRYLRAGNTPGGYVARGDKLFEIACPKIICLNRPFDDIALSARAIQISLLPSNRKLKPLDPLTLDQIAAEILPKVLMFRLTYFGRVRSSPVLVEQIQQFTPKMRELGYALAAPLMGDTRLEAKLIEALQAQDEDAASERSQDPMWCVVEALFDYCHRKGGEVSVGELADHVNQRRLFAEEECLFKARGISPFLKNLGIKTIRLGSWGRGVEFNLEFRRKVHALAKRFGITRREITGWMALKSGNGGLPCSLCAEFGLNAGLRFYSPPQSRRRPLYSEKDHLDLDPVADGSARKTW